jgi:hypothetical protein
MTANAMNALSWVGDVAKALGDAVATPRGTAPDRADGAMRSSRLRREHM